MAQMDEFFRRVTQNVETVIVGKREVIELVLVAMLCDGHVLLDDVPGVGKTMLARALAASLDARFGRLQCTPDLLPNDITGVSIYNQHSGQFEFQPGPVFANILLVDEVNRATPRTQAALLEAMQEQQVTVDGITHPLARPFLVIATQNPVEFEGTFPLPEAQLDRFLLRLSLGYPSLSDERKLLVRLRGEHPIHQVQPVVRGQDLLALQREVWDVHVDDTLQDYILNLVQATRAHHDLILGVSPRASLALVKTAQALALLRGRDHVIPEDVRRLVIPALAHRLKLKPEAELRGKTSVGVLQAILEDTPLPVDNQTHQ